MKDFLFCTILVTLWCNYNYIPFAFARDNKATESSSRVYKLFYNDEIGCSYVGAWLSHINLFRIVPYWVDISRAEAASTEVYNCIVLIFSLNHYDD